MPTNEKSKDAHVEGPPWRIEKRCATFDEADTIRTVLLEESENLQVKIHWMRSAQRRVFAVKTRIDPSTITPSSKKKRKRKNK